MKEKEKEREKEKEKERGKEKEVVKSEKEKGEGSRGSRRIDVKRNGGSRGSGAPSRLAPFDSYVVPLADSVARPTPHVAPSSSTSF
ncbi:MAG TPA: hypothetical protein VGR60_00895, partial [Gemmatimonadales bacterium]|nr:hypothetical protein [Gemmatimonadales bacterium]